jgi:chromosome partitioning protein
MRTIMCMNAKGGCGKTTIATSLATWYADDGARVALADFDPQQCALDWLKARDQYEGVPTIYGVDATQPPIRVPRDTDYLIMDAPAGTHGPVVNAMLKRTETLLVPVLPSPIDMRTVQRFIDELLHTGQVSHDRTRIALIANRVRENTRIFHELEEFLARTGVTFLGALRESQNYIRAAETGLGIFELAPSQVYKDVVQWDPITDWLASPASRPAVP